MGVVILKKSKIYFLGTIFQKLFAQQLFVKSRGNSCAL